MLYSPINYQGNKSRIVDYLLEFIPQNTTSIHEIFCGSGIVSFASNINNIYLNDINHYVLDLINYFRTYTAEEIIAKTDEIIEQYKLTNTYYEGKNKYKEIKHEGLSRHNKVAFNHLRADYNRDKDIVKLFVLIIYGFNHYLRFNKRDEYNVPVGKVDFVQSLRQRTIEYSRAVRRKNITMSNLDFRDVALYYNTTSTDLFYVDPPYLITNTVYNSSWIERDERNLLNLLDRLDADGMHFILSNVVESNGRVNTILKDWAKKYNIQHIHRQYLNSSYQKRNFGLADEVIIFNY